MAVRAVFKNGVFLPTDRVDLPEDTVVSLEFVEAEVRTNRLQDELRWLKSRTPEQVAAARARLAALAPPVTPVPEGKTLQEVVQNLWPGTESDEEVLRALEKLS